MYRPVLHFAILILTLTSGYGQNAKIEKKLDELLSKQFKPNEPGCEILVAKQGKIIYQKAFGSADLELNVPMQTGMVFKLASITKQFTAVAILQLAEKGKISLQDSLQKYVPGFPAKGHTITIENLLTHTSGIRDYMQIDYQASNMERWDFSPKQLIDSFKNQPLQFEPGTKFSYSNSGYYLLGYIIEKVSGQTYQSYISDHILQPLALQHMYFDSDGIIIPNRVNGYRKDGAVYRNADYWSPTITYAAGGLLSNAEDLLNWHKGLLAYKLVKKETLEKAFTPFTLKDGTVISYGYGWYSERSGSTRSIEHAGIMNGFITNEIYYPEQDVYIAALFNCQNAPRDQLSINISEIVLGQSMQTGIKVPDTILNRYAGTYSLTTDPGRTLIVSREGDHLVLKVTGQQTFDILFQTETKFELKNLKGITGEFVSENGSVTKIMVTQNGLFEWKRIK